MSLQRARKERRNRKVSGAELRPRGPTPGGLESAFGLTVKRQTLHGDVYKRLRHAIMSGAIKPGDLLSHRGIAQALGTSVMPVRDAVCRLVAELALVVHPNRTIGLPLLSQDNFEEICRIRSVLEGLAASEAALRIRPVQLAALRRLDGDMKKAKDYAAYMENNQQFHFIIYRAAEMPFLLAVVEMLWLQIGPLFNYIGRLGGGTDIPDRHEDAIVALERRDPVAARAAVEADIEGTRAFLAGILGAASGFRESRSTGEAPAPLRLARRSAHSAAKGVKGSYVSPTSTRKRSDASPNRRPIADRKRQRSIGA